MDSPKEKLRDSAMAENKKNILDCISLVGTSPCIFEGEKTYIRTGAVNHDYIDLSLAEKVTYQNRPSRANLSVKNGDILFAKMCGTQKTVCIDKKNAEYLFSTGFYAVRAKETVITSPLLYYLLDSEQFLKQKDQNCSGATQKAITNEGLKKIKISLPPLEEQRKIAAVLDNVSDLIAKRRQQLDKLDELVKSRFIEMFGDFKINTMRWPVVGFNEIAIIDGNMTTDYNKYANCPHIGIDSIEKGTGRLTGYRTVAEDGVISGKYIFTSKHIIYSKIRPNLNKVALPEFDGLCSADAYPILPMDGKCNRFFLAYNMRSQFFLDYILQFCNRTNLPKVNRKEVAGFQTPLPPIELQNQFADFVDQTEKTKTAISHSLQKLETLKKALMQSFFSKE